MARHYVLAACVMACHWSSGETEGGTPASSLSMSSTIGSTSTASDMPLTTGNMPSTSGEEGTSYESTLGSASATGEPPTSTGEASDSSGTGGIAVCGDGLLADVEECDDGNRDSFDGCSAGCYTEEPVTQICAGIGRTCILDVHGRVKCWGANLLGELGLGDMQHRGDEPGEMGAALPFVELGMKVQQLACGGALCALGTEGQVKCWGVPGSYLGLGTMDGVGDDPAEMGDALPAVELGESAIMIDNSARGACALLANGALKCWGYNADGQLGMGDTETRGDAPGEMGPALSPVDLGDMQASALISGHHVNCALDDKGRLKCWGKGRLLGLESGETRGDSPGEMGDILPVINLGAGAAVAHASARAGTTCAILVDGRLKCWGEDDDSNILWPFGNGLLEYGWQPGQMGDALPAYDLGGHKAITVETGIGSACVGLDDKSLKCWGVSVHGLMGNGSNKIWAGAPLVDVAPIDLGEGETLVQFSHQFQHACAVVVGGRVKCWGRNDAGELGYGDDDARGDEPEEMGEFLPYVEIF